MRLCSKETLFTDTGGKLHAAPGLSPALGHQELANALRADANFIIFLPTWSHAFFLRQVAEEFTYDFASPVRHLVFNAAELFWAGWVSGYRVHLLADRGSQVHLIATGFLELLRDLE